MTTVDDSSPPLSREQKKTIQEIIGAFLYYARIIDIITMLKKITVLGSVQATATENVARKVADFLQYSAMYPVTKVTYHASDMILHNHSDASYIGETRGRSQIAGFHFLGQQHRVGTISSTPINGCGLYICSSILNVFCFLLDRLRQNWGALREYARRDQNAWATHKLQHLCKMTINARTAYLMVQ